MANINLGEALISLIGGFLPGYAQGQKFKTEQQNIQQDRQRKIANEQKYSRSASRR